MRRNMRRNLQMTQMQHYEKARISLAEANEIFLFFVEHGMTAEELRKNIERSPEAWKQFENWLEKLP